MKKLILISFSILFFGTSSFAHEEPGKLSAEIVAPKVEKNIRNFLTYQKNVIKIKDKIWNIKKSLRDIYKIERWSVEKLERKTNEAEELRKGLSYEFKRLSEYEAEDFSRDFWLAKKILKEVSLLSENIDSELNSHHSMKVLLKDLDMLIEKANNKVRQLYRTQKTIDDVYRSKRPEGDESVSDLLRVGFLKRRVQTQNMIKQISRIKVEMEEIKKIRKNEFVLFKHSYKNYDITDSREKLRALKNEISGIISELEANIEEDYVTKKAIFLL